MPHRTDHVFFCNYVLLNKRFNALVIVKIELSFVDQLPNIGSGLKVIWYPSISTVITDWCLEYIQILGLTFFVIGGVWLWNAPTWRAAEAMTFAPVSKLSYFGLAITFKKLSDNFPALCMGLIKGYDCRKIEVSRDLLLCC